MFEEMLEELYNELAGIINEMIPVDWKKVYYLGEIEEGKLSWNSIFYFIDEEGEIVRSLDIPYKYNVSEEEYFELEEESQEVLLEIYDCFCSNNQELWNQLSCSFNSEGDFEVEFNYDSNDEGYGQACRETIWAYETFHYIPEEKFFKDMLQEYIDKKSGN